MAKFASPRFPHHSVRVRCDKKNGELLLVRDVGGSLYLWVGTDTDPKSVTTYTGRATLRRMARAILKDTE